MNKISGLRQLGGAAVALLLQLTVGCIGDTPTASAVPTMPVMVEKEPSEMPNLPAAPVAKAESATLKCLLEIEDDRLQPDDLAVLEQIADDSILAVFVSNYGVTLVEFKQLWAVVEGRELELGGGRLWLWRRSDFDVMSSNFSETLAGDDFMRRTLLFSENGGASMNVAMRNQTSRIESFAIRGYRLERIFYRADSSPANLFGLL